MKDRHGLTLILSPQYLPQQHLPTPAPTLVPPNLLRLVRHRLVTRIPRQIHAHSTPRKGGGLFWRAAPVPACRIQGARNPSPSALPLLGRGALVTDAALVVLSGALVSLAMMVDKPMHEAAGKVLGLVAEPLVVAIFVVRVCLKDGNAWRRGRSFGRKRWERSIVDAGGRGWHVVIV